MSAATAAPSAAVPTMESFEMIVYEQPGGGTRGLSYVTPLSSIFEKTPQRFTKADIQTMVNSIRAVACQGNVSDRYIRDTALVVNTVIMVLCLKEQKEKIISSRRTVGRTETVIERKPIGFICARPDDDNGKRGMYIDVVCSIKEMKMGNALLNYFLEYAKTKSANFIGLSSLPSVLGYYPRIGYEFRKSCDPSAEIIPPSTEIASYIRERRGPIPETSTNAYDIEPYADFMVKLHEHDLAVSKERGCGKAKITKDELKSDDCGSDGFSMKRCTLGGGRRRKRMNRTRRSNK